MALPEPVPASAPLAAPVTTTHHVISYTYPSTSLRTGDSLHRLITATYSTGEFYHYAYPSTALRAGLGSTVAVSERWWRGRPRRGLALPWETSEVSLAC
jgi:hypothetical protein